MVKKGSREICGHQVGVEEVRLIFKCENLNKDNLEVNSDNDVLILLDVTPDASMIDEGLAREIINRVQKLRKKAHLVPTDEVAVFYKCDGELGRIAKEYTEFIEGTIKAGFKDATNQKPSDQLIIEETMKLKESNIYIALTKNSDVEVPVVNWVNLELLGKAPRYCRVATKGMVLLEVANQSLTMRDLEKGVSKLFGVENFELWTKKGRVENLKELSGGTVFVVPVGYNGSFPEVNGVPFCKLVNFEERGVKGTVLLENPQGVFLRGDVKDVISKWVNMSK